VFLYVDGGIMFKVFVGATKKVNLSPASLKKLRVLRDKLAA